MFRSTFTGSFRQLLNHSNRWIWRVFFYTGAWVPLIAILTYKVFFYNPLDVNHYEAQVWVLSIAVSIAIFVFNLRRDINNANSLEQDNIPDYTVYTSRENVGFFFGTKTKGSIFSQQKYYIGKPIDQDGHILVVGGAGSYKTSAIAIPTLGTWDGLILAIDVKGDLLEKWRCLNVPKNKSVKVFNPLNADACAYDPFALLRDGGAENLVHNARELTLSILQVPPDTKDPIWIKSAQNLLTASILHFFDLGKSFSDTMTEIQKTPISELFRQIVEADFDPAMMYISKLYGLEMKQMAGIGMELTSLILFAIDPSIKAALCPDEKVDVIDWGEWSSLENDEDLYDIIMQVPEDKLDQWETALTLMLNQLIRTLERRADKHSADGKTLPPILIMLDEFPRLGKLKAIQSALATLRSRGVTICLVVQSLAQLDEIYGVKARQTIVDNCPYKAILNATDPSSQEYFSKIVGTSEVMKESHSVNVDSESNAERRGVSQSMRREAIIHPHEFATLKDIVLMTPEGYCRVEKAPYFEDEEYRMIQYVQEHFPNAENWEIREEKIVEATPWQRIKNSLFLLLYDPFYIFQRSKRLSKSSTDRPATATVATEKTTEPAEHDESLDRAIKRNMQEVFNNSLILPGNLANRARIKVMQSMKRGFNKLFPNKDLSPVEAGYLHITIGTMGYEEKQSLIIRELIKARKANHYSMEDGFITALTALSCTQQEIQIAEQMMNIAKSGYTKRQAEDFYYFIQCNK